MPSSVPGSWVKCCHTGASRISPCRALRSGVKGTRTADIEKHDRAACLHRAPRGQHTGRQREGSQENGYAAHDQRIQWSDRIDLAGNSFL
jgi:hypothetical protein